MVCWDGQIKSLRNGFCVPDVWVCGSVRLANGGTILPNSVVSRGTLSLPAKEAGVQSQVKKGTLCFNPILFPLNRFIFGGFEVPVLKKKI